MCVGGGAHACVSRGVCLWRPEVNLRSFTCFSDEISPWEPSLTDQARLSGKRGSGRLLSLPVQCSDCGSWCWDFKWVPPYPFSMDTEDNTQVFMITVTLWNYILLYIKFIIILLTDLSPQSSKAYFFKSSQKFYTMNICACVFIQWYIIIQLLM